MGLLKRITKSTTQCGGHPCIRGLGIRVTDVLDMIADGLSHTEILAALPALEAEDIKACLKYISL